MDNKKKMVVGYGMRVKVTYVRDSELPGCVVVIFQGREYHVSSWLLQPCKEGNKNA